MARARDEAREEKEQREVEEEEEREDVAILRRYITADVA